MTEFHDATQQAAERKMMSRALELGANAVVAVRYQVVAPPGGLYSVMCYGTAVNIEPLNQKDGEQGAAG
jgi:uncharacterized protein YbjQ (UPF0145 family)